MAQKKTKIPVLRVENLSISYGYISAVKQVSLEVNEGEIVALIGSNGAGKSTLLNAVLGICPPLQGRVLFMGRDITRRSPDNIVASGISVVPEGRGILPLMTVLENLQLGAYHISSKDKINENLNQVFVRFPILGVRKNQLAGTLSGGEQQMLAIARALMAAPKLILMDEPSLGLAPLIINEVFDMVMNLKKNGHTILLTEQKARKALQYADRGYVFEQGNIVLEGTAQELTNNQRVREAYLGSIDS